MKNALITGANGLVGQSIANALSYKWEGTSFSRSSSNLHQLDVTNSQELTQFLDKHNFSTIFHCVNMSGGVNRCEQEPELAKKVHLTALHPLIAYCREKNATLVFISTDYVFNNHQQPVTEDDSPEPLNIYGQLKLQAEELIREQIPRHIIARTTNVYGHDPETQTPNFFMQILRSLASNSEFSAPENLNGTPTYVEDLAQCLCQLDQKESFGTFHIVGDEKINRFEWAKIVAKTLGLDTTKIYPVQASEGQVKRPTHLFLDNKKVKEELGFRFKGLKTVLEELKRKGISC